MRIRQPPKQRKPGCKENQYSDLFPLVRNRTSLLTNWLILTACQPVSYYIIYWKGSLLVALDYGRQLTTLFNPWLEEMGFSYLCQEVKKSRSITLISTYFLLLLPTLCYRIYTDLIWFINRTLTGTNTPDQSGTGIHGNEVGTTHSSELQQWSLTIGCNLVSYPKHPLFWEGLTSLPGIHSAYCPVGWGCRIHRQHLCRGLRLPQLVSWIWH